MERVKKIFLIMFEVIIIAYVILITTLLLVRNKFGYTQFGDSTFVNVNKSNFDVFSDFNRGDLVILDRPLFNKVKLGDYLYYYTVQNNTYVIEKGKVLSKTGDNKGYVYTLDNIDGIDVSQDRIIGSFNGDKYANIGGILDILESTVGFLIFVILPILLIFIYQFYNLVILIKDPTIGREKAKRTTKKVTSSKTSNTAKKGTNSTKKTTNSKK